ncbi:ATPase family AAA domain-containing protein 1-A [Fusarium austroafricanum]|uniref:ATPase family AAA domain-containing protein 1-A n=1 Tax=Fusarium austroafricanum TaxID=2364996 RepID=A0A8H4KVZ9_9HYPO|nr:ATPase family AAA domain-containing protein 1-A [Fusarium austroafricanum]
MKFPPWMSPCFKGLASVNSLAARLSIRRGSGLVSKPDLQTKPTQQDTNNYEIEECIYEEVQKQLFELLHREPTYTLPGDEIFQPSDAAVILHPPNDGYVAEGLIEALAAKLTQDIGGRLLMLDSDDIIDFLQHIDDIGYEDADDEIAPHTTPFVIRENLVSPAWWPRDEYNDKNVEKPVVVVFNRIFDESRWFEDYEDQGGLRSELQGRSFPFNKHQGSLLAVIKNDSKLLRAIRSVSDEILRNVRSVPAIMVDKRSLEISCIGSPNQERLYTLDQIQHQQSHIIRRLQRLGRYQFRSIPWHSPLQPNAEWIIPKAVEAVMYKPEIWNSQRLRAFTSRISCLRPVTMQAIVRALEESLGVEWRRRYPQHIWPVIEKIMEAEGVDYSTPNAAYLNSRSPEEEERSMEHTLDATWNDIQLEPRIEAKIKRMISLFDRRLHLTGILKRCTTAGALLYGPPGTGKTHLARVIANESSAVMLRISTAEIGSKWYGETEKQIRALFSLARKLSPAIVFIDEADAIFPNRSGSDKEWRRGLVNQFLGEIGGFENSASSPLLILATNLPQYLDPAVLRRVPTKIFVDLPSLEARERIFEMCLKKESLNNSVDMKELAQATDGYTGSDIEFICQQAVFAALEDFEADLALAPDIPIVIGMSHFNYALNGSNPSVARSTMESILKFAAEFDCLASVRPEQTKKRKGSWENLKGWWIPVQHTGCPEAKIAETQEKRDAAKKLEAERDALEKKVLEAKSEVNKRLKEHQVAHEHSKEAHNEYQKHIDKHVHGGK